MDHGCRDAPRRPPARGGGRRSLGHRPRSCRSRGTCDAPRDERRPRGLLRGRRRTRYRAAEGRPRRPSRDPLRTGHRGPGRTGRRRSRRHRDEGRGPVPNGRRGSFRRRRGGHLDEGGSLMFTGIVIERGSVKKVRERGGMLELEIEAPQIARELKVGDSVAVNGVCLTATATGRRRFTTQAMPETTAKTTIGKVTKGEHINLELPARLTDRLGGHLVQGHVDGVAQVVRIEDDEDARRVWFTADEGLLRYMVDKGSVTLDGGCLLYTS